MPAEKFRKRPVVIEAMKVDGDVQAVVDWIASHGGHCWTGEYTVEEYGRISYPFDGAKSVWINTLEGAMRADPGSFVIRGVKGEFYPCAADIFEATYEPVPADPDGETTS